MVIVSVLFVFVDESDLAPSTPLSDGELLFGGDPLLNLQPSPTGTTGVSLANPAPVPAFALDPQPVVASGM